MRDTRIIMGMPVTIDVADATKQDVLETIFSYFVSVDERFSTYKKDSEISRINRREISEENYSKEMKEVFLLAEHTNAETSGYFNIRRHGGMLDPSGVVKGWAIRNAARMLSSFGYRNFYVDAGGDIQSSGKNTEGNEWTVGIRNPFNRGEIVKVVYPRGAGVATSGTYIRGQHIYNPHSPLTPITDIVSLTVIGPDIYEADRFATAAFAMGQVGIVFIEGLDGFEGYVIGSNGMGTATGGFKHYTTPS